MRRLVLLLAGALTVVGLAGCGKAPAGETPTQKAESALFAQMDKMGYTNITVTTEIEDASTKASPKPTPSTAQTPNRIITATPRSTGGKPSAKPSASPSKSTAAKTMTVISAVGKVPDTLCWANIEQIPGQALEFDEVIIKHDGTLDPDGIDVEGDARKNITPDGVRAYMQANHPECFAP